MNGARPSETGPFVSAVAITPTDATNLANGASRAILVGTAGNIKLLFANDTNPVVVNGLVAGVVYNFRAIQIYATSTTATNIVALY